jgi:hypothetical protein
MIFDARPCRAIDHYLKQNGPRLELQLRATPSTVYMTERATGKSVTVDIDFILEIYDRDRKEAAKERARLRRLEKRGTGRAYGVAA